ncbi:hypothetical protein [Nocardia brasiliensis]
MMIQVWGKATMGAAALLLAVTPLSIADVPSAVAEIPPWKPQDPCRVVAHVDYDDSVKEVFGSVERKGDHCDEVTYKVQVVIVVNDLDFPIASKDGKGTQFKDDVTYECDDPDVTVKARTPIRARVDITEGSGKEDPVRSEEIFALDGDC